MTGAEHVAACVGKRILSMRIEPATRGEIGALRIELEGGAVLWLRDAQCCCEARYFTSDDINDGGTYYRGAMLLAVEVADATTKTADGFGDEHEVQFLEVRTSLGVVTVEAHNEHNGWYGGITLRAEVTS